MLLTMMLPISTPAQPTEQQLPIKNDVEVTIEMKPMSNPMEVWYYATVTQDAWYGFFKIGWTRATGRFCFSGGKCILIIDTSSYGLTPMGILLGFTKVGFTHFNEKGTNGHIYAKGNFKYRVTTYYSWVDLIVTPSGARTYTSGYGKT